MDVRILPLLGDNYAYVLVSDGEAAVIDPPLAGPVMELVASLGVRLVSVLITHHHMDHTGGCRELKACLGCEVFGPDDNRVPEVDRAVGEGDTVQLGGEQFRVLCVPGHTRSHIAFHDAHGSGAVWTGDAMFIGGCGRPFEGTPEDMWGSLCKLRALPEETCVYCGHNYTVENMEFAHHLDLENRPVGKRLEQVRALDRSGKPTVPSTIGLEREMNIFLRADDPFVAEAVGLPDEDPVKVFAELRSRKDRW